MSSAIINGKEIGQEIRKSVEVRVKRIESNKELHQVWQLF